MERYRSAAEIIRSATSLSRGTRVLDVGCGEGYMRHFFDADEGEWHGVECWPERVEICRALGYTVVDIDINTTPLPYPDGHFEVVMASHVIEHLSNIRFAIAEMNRVLKANGILLIATPTKPPGVHRLLEAYHARQKKRLGETQHAFSAASLQRMIRGALPGYALLDARGLRVLSMRTQLKLENFYAFYRVNTMLAKHLTWIVPEVNLIYRKPARTLAHTPSAR